MKSKFLLFSSFVFCFLFSFSILAAASNCKNLNSENINNDLTNCLGESTQKQNIMGLQHRACDFNNLDNSAWRQGAQNKEAISFCANIGTASKNESLKKYQNQCTKMGGKVSPVACNSDNPKEYGKILLEDYISDASGQVTKYVCCQYKTRKINRILVKNVSAATNTGDGAQTASICDALVSPEGQGACKKCMGNEENPVGFWTGIGCISTNPIGAISQLLNFLLGIGGFFVMVQILVGAFKILTSRGDPKGMQDAKERITNSIIALLFIVFSVSILQFVGISIFNLPGFFSN